ncbi:dephospho-CoA kinase [Odoribacter sp. OttesenSCG-928-J03]|nr:dephospho-CoA kinase [Odoribacter sp. OttesenSCG-928-J03]
MLRIGLTGGIGSGKTTIAEIFSNLKYPIYISDQRANHLINSDPQIKSALTGHFGKDIYTPEGCLDKKELANIIFQDKAALNFVNQTVHPRVLEDFTHWAEQQTGDMVLFESAILFEAGLEGYFDYIICIYAPLELRVKRVARRDHIAEEKVMERINNQMDDREKCRKSDFIINTDEGADLLQQVKEIIKTIETNERRIAPDSL